MRIEDMLAALEPFANAADAFRHNMAGVPKPGEHVFKHNYVVQGVEKLAAFTVDDIFKLELAYNFIKSTLANQQAGQTNEGADLKDEVSGEIKKNPSPEEVSGAQKLPADDTTQAGE